MPKRIPGGRVDKEIAIRKSRLLKALERHKGLVSFACKAAKVSTPTYYTYLEDDPEFAKQVAEIKEGVIDFVEGKLFSAIEEGEYIPSMFYLKCQGKKRGYLEKQEIKISGDSEHPVVPDSVVQAALAAIIKSEEERLAHLPKGSRGAPE